MVVAGVTAQRDTDLLRGVLDLCVLAVLAVEPTHAYEVVERLRAKGFESVGYNTIYPLVTRLRRRGLLAQESYASSLGPIRKVLTLTPAGRSALTEWRERWKQSTESTIGVLADLDESDAKHND